MGEHADDNHRAGGGLQSSGSGAFFVATPDLQTLQAPFEILDITLPFPAAPGAPVAAVPVASVLETVDEGHESESRSSGLSDSSSGSSGSSYGRGPGWPDNRQRSSRIAGWPGSQWPTGLPTGLPTGVGRRTKRRRASQTSPPRHRDYDETSWACGNWFEFLLVVVLAIILLVGALVLVLFWVIYYRQGFAWTEDPIKEFNLHPVLMIAGFITFSGFSMLLYRIGRCCRRIYVKLFHTIFHALAVPCVVVGFIAVLDSHNLANPPIRNFYSLHSWMGFVTMGLFALQFIVGFFSFLILLCCENATAGFRASLVPIHATFGILTFMLAVATCLTGLTEKAFLTPGFKYVELPEEAFILNALAMVLVGLAILLVYAVRRETFRVRAASIISQRL